MLTLRDVMTADTVTLAPEMTLRDAVELLAAKRVSGAPVLANDRVVGMLSANDILSFFASTPGVPTNRGDTEPRPDAADGEEEGMAPPGSYSEFWPDTDIPVDEYFSAMDGPEWDVLGAHTVAEAMTTRILKLPASASLHEAADAMQKLGVHRVIVTRGKRLLGIVTTMDVTKAFASNLSAERKGPAARPPTSPRRHR